jgi:predicted hydrocarbon binding protein
MKSAFKGFRPMMQNFYTMWGELCKAFYKKFGKEAIPIITEISGKSGAAQAELTQKMMPVKDMKGAGEVFKMMDSMMEIGLEIVELTDDSIRFRVAKCVNGLEGTSRELCEAMMTSDAKMMSTLLGQEIEMQILKSVAVGDNECEVVFSKR